MPASDYQKFSGSIQPLSDHVLVCDMEKGEKVSAGGIITLDDSGKDRGIRPRWARAYKVGSNIDYIKEGEWVLVEHGQWTWGLNFRDEDIGQDLYIQRINLKGVLAVSDVKPF